MVMFILYYLYSSTSMFLIPKNFGIAGSIGVLAFNDVIGGLIGGITVIARMIAVFVEIIKISQALLVNMSKSVIAEI